MNLEQAILEELQANPGLKAVQLAQKLGKEKNSINSLLYGRLKGKCYQDKEYRWYLTNNSTRPQAEPTKQQFANTSLAKICRYYLSCLGQDDEGGVSVFAANNFGDLDYVEVSHLPTDGAEDILQTRDAQRLIGKIRRDRSRLEMHFGYPTTLKKVHSKKTNWVGCFVEPILLFPVEFDSSQSSPKINFGFPSINLPVLKRFTNTEREGVIDEIVQLEEELGFLGDSLPDLDELSQRLQALRPEWPWKEAVCPDRLNSAPALGTIGDEGVYNRAVLVVGERSPYTQGLEAELKVLAQLNESEYSSTALGEWVSGNISPPAQQTEKQLVEVLPLNLEQRQSVTQSMQNKLTIVTGPPGTGKSQVVSNILINAAWQGKRVLFASKNNKAVDVVETRINNLGPRPILLRVGSNQYQTRLAEYLISLLSATATQEDQLEFDEAKQLQDRTLARLKTLNQEELLLIQSRNTVDQLEQKVELARKDLSTEVFSAMKALDLHAVNTSLRYFHTKLNRATREKQSLLIRFLWAMVKNGRYQDLGGSLEETMSSITSLRPRVPGANPDDGTIGRWQQFYNEVSTLVSLAPDVQAYFLALENLQKLTPLEDIAKEKFQLQKSLSQNAEKLWHSWLRLHPTRLSASDRRMLTKYNAVLKMVVDSGPEGKLGAEIKKQYYGLFPEAAHLLPCWAVTSLSARGKIPLQPGFFDLVVIDEASQCDIASALPLLYRAKQAVIIGDPKQLSHISAMPKGQDQKLLEQHGLVHDYAHWAYSYNSLFDLASGLASGEDIVTLRDHHRSHADIIEFSNKNFYEGRLRVATRYNRLIRPQDDGRGVRWVKVSGDVARPSTGGAVNVNEAEEVVKVIKHLVLSQGYKGSIGVVSPFRAQANMIREAANRDELLSSRLIQHDFLADTVHKFQGDERDLMIFSPVVSRGTPAGAIGFLRNNGNLFNVAITRARGMLLVVGDMQAASACEVSYLADFARYAQNLADIEEKKVERELYDHGPEYPVVHNPEQVSDWEKILYRALYKAGVRPLPQYHVEKYILDMALFEDDRSNYVHMLNIEVDGERYHRNWTGELCHRDQLRNQRLYELGWDVMRFWVYEIRDDLDGCVNRVQKWLDGVR